VFHESVERGPPVEAQGKRHRGQKSRVGRESMKFVRLAVKSQFGERVEPGEAKILLWI